MQKSAEVIVGIWTWKHGHANRRTESIGVLSMTEKGGMTAYDRKHKWYAKAARSFNRIWKERDSAQPKLLEAILYNDNLNRAYKRVKANKGAPGIDGMNNEEGLP